jgi:hypothetical protein
MPNWSRSAYLIVPVLFLLVAYWKVFYVWFRSDDFAWLGLKLSIDGPAKLFESLFFPQAQGTIRILSERVPYLTLSTLFGYETWPFRLLALATQALNGVLLGLVAVRITGSKLVGGLAPVLWLLNAGMAVALCWFASYNQILAATFLLGAFYCFLQRRTVATWAIFLLGFAVLEINVVLPGLLLWYALLLDRPRLRECLPFFLPSLVFVALHLWVIPKVPDPSYKLYLDADLPATLWYYVSRALGPERWADVQDLGAPWHRYGTPALAVGALAFLFWQARQRDWRGLFFLGCFIITIAPVVPLKAHRIDYYQACASFGMALFLAWAFVRSWQASRVVGAVALVALGTFLWTGYNLRRITLGWYLGQTQHSETLVRNVREVRRLHPDKTILLANLERLLFFNGVADDPFRLYGIKDVWLAPGANPALAKDVEAPPFTYPAANVLWAADRDRVRVYQWEPTGLRAVTRSYLDGLASEPAPSLPHWADWGRPQFAELLGEGWTEINQSNHTRAMLARAVFRFGGLLPPASKLHLLAFAPAGLGAAGPVTVTAKFNGVANTPTALPVIGAPFDLDLPIPDSVRSAPVLEIELSCNRTVQDANGRQTSLVFGRVDIRQF